MKKIFEILFNTFFPPLCSCCGHPLVREMGEQHICIECLSKWERPTYTNILDNKMSRRFWGTFPVEGAMCAFIYNPENLISPVIAKIKYKGMTSLCRYLGKVMCEEPLISDLLNGVDMLVPVPLSPKRQKHRGYNQCHELCKGISELRSIPISHDALQRVTFSASQTTMTADTRADNVRDAFVVKDDSALSGKHIVLVDDIMTTGATLIECLMALRKIQDIKISILTLCKTES